MRVCAERLTSGGDRMPRKRAQTSTVEAGFWRIASDTKANLDRAMRARLWGMRRRVGVRQGDRIAFYVSKGSNAGYWGTATITSDLFLDATRVWPDDVYPIRFRLKPDGNPRSTPVTRAQLMERLGRPRLTYQRQSGVIRLSKDEFETLVHLLRPPTPGHRGTTEVHESPPKPESPPRRRAPERYRQ